MFFMQEAGEMKHITFTFGLEVESINGLWALDQSQFINEFGWPARMVMLSLTLVGTSVGIVVGTVVLRNTVRQG